MRHIVSFLALMVALATLVIGFVRYEPTIPSQSDEVADLIRDIESEEIVQKSLRHIEAAWEIQN
jgi:hypothetical protein